MISQMILDLLCKIGISRNVNSRSGSAGCCATLSRQPSQRVHQSCAANPINLNLHSHFGCKIFIVAIPNCICSSKFLLILLRHSATQLLQPKKSLAEASNLGSNLSAYATIRADSSVIELIDDYIWIAKPLNKRCSLSTV